MRVQTRSFQNIRILFWGLLLILLFAVQWGMNVPVMSAEEDPYEILQISRLSERIEAPDFSLASVNGGTQKLSDYKGNVVFLNFWTTW